MKTPLFIFTAHVTSGSGRGKRLQVPTINVTLDDVPHELEEGIYACFVELGDEMYHPASMHYGPRPVFKDTPSCEVHLLDQGIPEVPEIITIHIIEYVRPVRDFPSEAALLEQIASDNAAARAILNV